MADGEGAIGSIGVGLQDQQHDEVQFAELQPVFATHLRQGGSIEREANGPYTQFDFRGYTFRPRVVKNRKRNSMFVSFTPAVSKSALKSGRQTTRELNYQNRTNLSLRILPNCTTRSCAVGSGITGGSVGRRCIRCVSRKAQGR